MSAVNPSSQYKDLSQPMLGANPFLPHSLAAGVPLSAPPMVAGLPTDPFFLQRLQNMVNLNMLLASQQAAAQTNTSSSVLPPTMSPPLKLPFAGLSQQFLTANQLLQSGGFPAIHVTQIDEKKHSIDLLRLKAKQHSANDVPITTSAKI